MHCDFISNTACVGIVALWLGVSAEVRGAEILDVEKEAVAARRAVHSGSLDIVTTKRVMNPDREERFVYKVWFQGGRFRLDTLRPHAGTEPLRSIECFSGDVFSRWSDYGPTGAKVGFEMAPLDPKAFGGDKPQPYDPRFIGTEFWHSCNSPTCKFELLFLWPGRQKVAAKDTLWKGVKAQEITIERGGDIIREVIVPDEGHSLVYLGVAEKKDKGLNDSLTTEYVKHKTPTGDLWFPSRSSFRHEMAGNLIEERVLITDNVKLNIPLPEEVFSIEGMEIPAGTAVFDHVHPENKEPKHWNGSRIVTGDATRRADNSPAWTYYLVRGAGVILFFCAIGMFWKLMGKGRR